MTNKIIEALMAKYQADKLAAVANLQNYFNNPVAVGEHPDIITECDKLVKQIADAEGNAQTLKMAIESSQPKK